MAKICLLLTTAPWWDQRHFHKQAPALAAAGHDVVFVSDKINDNIKFNFESIVLSKTQRRLARKTGSLNLINVIRKIRPDIIQLCSIEQLPLGLYLKKFTKIKVVYDCREDMFNSMLYSKERFPKVLRIILSRMTRFLENHCDRVFDGLVGSDPAILNIHYGMNNEKKCLFHNVPLKRQFTGIYPKLREREYDITLLGGMGYRSGMGTLIRAIEYLKQKQRNVKILLVGEPPENEKKALNSKLVELDYTDNLTITGIKLYHEIPEILIKAKIGMVLLEDLPKFQNNIACKAFEYMACGMPIISSDLPPERLILKDNENALFFKPGDHISLVDKILYLLDNIELSEKLGANGRAEFEKRWNADEELVDYCEFYNKLMSYGK